jgi:uroporphyrin-III C-methyltransferase
MLASLNCSDEVHLLIGVSGLTFTRVQTVLANGASPIVITQSDDDSKVSHNLKNLENEEKVQVLRRVVDVESDLLALGRSRVGGVVDKVFVNLPSHESALKKSIFEKCQQNRIPINTTDSAEYSTFTLLSTHIDGDFQLGVTTSGKGCKLANRIKREIVAQLPKDISQICERVGSLRQRIQEEDRFKLSQFKDEYEKFLELELGEHEEDAVQSSKFNTFVSEFNMTETQQKLQRSRWLSQIVEYYPFSKLAEISIDDLTSAYASSTQHESPAEKAILDTPTATKKGAISLVGAGPGSVSLLTIGALHEITTADLVLADKLVPQQVLDLIPFKTEKFIARKFPGNAEAAQDELLTLGLKALKEGKKVVRLKQGDPYIFGRGGEEYIFFEEHGFTPVVLPGITSALSSTVSSQITATQRDVADQVLICTGTGRRGVLPNLPEYVETRTTVFLMSLHRITDLVPALISNGWDPRLPAAIVERSSCPDQRVTRTRLEDLIDAVEAIGSRPPGLLVLGKACEVLTGKIEEKWRVDEGYDSEDKQVIEFLKIITA